MILCKVVIYEEIGDSAFVLKYITPLTFFYRLTVRLFYKYFSKSINEQIKSKVHWIIDNIHFTLVN
jgi:hypothetical protein